ncbi:sugar phosphate isomerase/epimerase family protein [Paenactinomyces guangxiensis]|uniref:Sugar phosphate isomerase/epimerase n=1 Tax=Paenactinomyces guangxiensis TaxID=1490290 RepID=A0A7W2A6Q3_9BACL|nr:sugar phosphate isomerase/epimerase [Paenactinomyces guangxiensis]MBA4492785.1 sugar phosphate isomerase/epimerase [Paenactinomyces guangxiensis]MBH8590366.1 sugar phosphate isomerase/epimerase [Paenactinomyces guangxiensis]
MSIPIGVQLYTLRNEAEKDFVGVLEKVKEIGYEGIEFAGFGGLSVREVKKAVDQQGLVPVSSHVPLDLLEYDLDQVIADHAELGVKFLVCPWVEEERRKGTGDYQKLAETFNHIGRKCLEAGFQFCYHHHEFEFVRFSGEQVPALDLLLQQTNERNVHLELDVYWAAYAGESPVQYLKRYQGRCPLVHLKDMEALEKRSFAEVGEGILPIGEIIAASHQTGVEWLIVEQDECQRPPLESVRISMENLRKKGYVAGV